ncbi:MAG: hypothetical protein KGO92_00160 [Bacteroidota bacterium]|nr:hypothetical protein [Bacteroidota bacterium]
MAAICMVLFAFGITPKLTLHNLVANHRDGRTKTSLPDPNTTQLSTASYNCQCDNPVTESPFFPADQIHCQLPDNSYPVFTCTFAQAIFAADFPIETLRGPPVV